ncbi:MAG: TonB-dependent receptor [Bacteroidota bacterium]|nr:TonB-dependent receptor [Bacteroidota bacterium]
MKKTLFSIAAILSAIFSFAQQKHTISGIVKDQKTGETLIGASIILLESPRAGALSNGYGFYSINAPERKYILVASFSGYEDDSLKISLTKDIVRSIELRPEGTKLNEIRIAARRRDNITQTLPGMQNISIEEIKNVPVLFGEKDILKTIQLLPGIKSGGDGSTGFFVRGGAADQNLILLDEATVYNASHLLGFFSTFNSDAIKDVTIYKGDMPAQYGGRLSSLLDIKMNDGNNKNYHVTGGIGLIASRLNVEGPIVKDKGSFMISARRTYADVFLKLSKDTNVNKSILYFYDINAKANYQFGEKNKLFLSAYLGQDDLGYSNQFGIKWGNVTTTLRWNHIFSSKLFSNTSLIYSNYNYNIIINQTTNNLSILSKIEDYTLKEDLQYFGGAKNKINFGFNLTKHIFTPGEIQTSLTSSFNSLSLQHKYSLDGAAYVSDEWNLSDKIKFNTGLRLSSFNTLGPGKFYTYDNNGKAIDTSTYSSGKIVKSYLNLQPRFAANYQLNKLSSVKLSYSRNVQNLHLLSNSTGSNPTDLWIPSSNNVKPEIADQVSFGYYRNLKSNQYELSAEVYYKFLQNQIDYKNGAVLVANEAVESQLVYGKGRAYGLELFAKKKYGKLTGWISYTLSRTERKIDQVNNNSWYPATQDQTHNIAIVAILKAGKKWTLSSDFVFNTGNAVTWPSGKYSVNGTTVYYYSERNSYRMPPYHRLDMSATLQGKKTSKFDGSWTFSVYNVYGRENPYFVQFQSDPNNIQRTQAIQYSLFRWVPSITYNFKF